MDPKNPYLDANWPREKSLRATIWDVVKFALLTLAIVLPIRAFVAQPFIVSGQSMDPTFRTRQYLIIDELSYFFRQPERGEVIVFRFPEDPSKFFIKRVIGLPGETISIRANKVTITTTDKKVITLDEPYTQGNTYPSINTTLKDKEYFVMGDNRELSYDSRRWGALPREMIKGRALVRLFPPSQIGLLPGDYSNQDSN